MRCRPTNSSPTPDPGDQLRRSPSALAAVTVRDHAVVGGTTASASTTGGRIPRDGASEIPRHCGVDVRRGHVRAPGDRVTQGPGGETAPEPAAAQPVAPPAASEAENLFWQSIMHSTNPAEFEAYLRRFPERHVQRW